MSLAQLRDISPDFHNSAATAVKTREAGDWPVLDLPLLAEAICELADQVDALAKRLRGALSRNDDGHVI